jgi:hypothetical protein
MDQLQNGQFLLVFEVEYVKGGCDRMKGVMIGFGNKVH